MNQDLNANREPDLPSYTTTPVDDIPAVRGRLKDVFKTGRTRPIQFRKQQLLALAYLIKDNIPLFQRALASDLRRSDTETFVLEIGGTLTEAVNAYHNVAKWSKPERAPWSLNWFATKPTIRKEPKGVVLIISPFNYPVWLLLRPLVAAIAAGNACVLKPSELTPAFSALIAELVPKYLDPESFAVINGAIPETTKAGQLQWDHILYTGGSRVASIVLAAAAKTLSPVTTELGGKSPAVIDPSCDLKLTARRLIWGKVANAGQTCIAPDYALVPKGFVDQFVQACKDVLKDFYPEGAESSDSFCRIVSASHFARIKGLLDRTDGQIVFGGSTNEEKKFIEPTLVTGVNGDDSLMGEEIFGPVLPIIEVDDVDEAIKFINDRDHPLALYVFSPNSAFKSKVIENTQSGTVVINDTMIQAAAEGLPFGGIGPSGSGYTSGKFAFDMFTHLRSTLDNPGIMDYIMKFRYPPYNEKKRKLFTTFMFPSLPARTAAGGNAAPTG
ncbi:NAD-aldehyde dehydrogenase [Lactarius akahatsu]|uniref:Aldehyde dehydrogenase n=1 Tax=Lactarius akahatsu TaxID=416441 RepID=A0AAD4LLL7_9AGAM|nr:NAD-aldehyde dehydrogenase [Lactarius akahatsu]